MDKLHDYQGCLGRLHGARDKVRAKWQAWRAEHPQTPMEAVKETLGIGRPTRPPGTFTDAPDYSHIYRSKTRAELIRVSAAVMGIEFSYAAETAFVSPTLLKIGVEHQHMTLVWALSPLVGFFLTPVLGSMSDRCRHPAGRRRPFIMILAIGVFLGLILVPNGENIGYAFGDFNPYATNSTEALAKPLVLAHRTSSITTQPLEVGTGNLVVTTIQHSHPWGVFFTILGTVLLDFDADGCQSPARAYLLDVTIPEDHARGLSTFTIMAGLGGFCGYALGGINWDVTALGIFLGGHVRAVFTLITVIFVVCVSFTITSFPEIPLDVLEKDAQIPITVFPGDPKPKEQDSIAGDIDQQGDYGTTKQKEHIDLPARKKYPLPMLPTVDYDSLDGSNIPGSGAIHPEMESGAGSASLSYYLMSILKMPYSMKMICLTNLFCWMAHVCYSLYFTDFVGEAVFGGNPKAEEGTIQRELYEEGVRFGCWGMSMYSLSCACYSLVIEKLILRFRAKRVYVGGLLFYSIGMMLMALTKHKVGVIVFSWAAGVMYSTLFTMPYLLIAHYHAHGIFEETVDGEAKIGTQIRGLGTDVAIVSSMVFLAQFILSMCMGTIVTVSGTTTAVVSVASMLAFFGSIAATRVIFIGYHVIIFIRRITFTGVTVMIQRDYKKCSICKSYRVTSINKVIHQR